MGSVSPDGGYHMLQVKREPSEASPVSYMYGGNVSPMYPGTSPGPPSPNSTPSPVPYTYTNMSSLRHSAGGGLIEVKPTDSNPFKAGPDGGVPLTYPNIFPAGSTGPEMTPDGAVLYVDQSNRLAGPNPAGKTGEVSNGSSPDVRISPKMEGDTIRSHGTGGNTMLDMDSQQYSLELNLGNLDSAELTRMAMMTDANLSENLSSNLTLDDKVTKSSMECDQNNMTDSFTRVANNVIQELVSLGDMSQGGPQH